MDIEQALVILLKADVAVTAVVAGRVFGGRVPQSGRFPLLWYESKGGPRPVRTLRGGTALVEQDFLIYSAAEGIGNLSVAADLDYAVIHALDEYFGTVSDTQSPPDTIDIQRIVSSPGICHEHFWDDEREVHEYVTEFNLHFLDPHRIPSSP